MNKFNGLILFIVFLQKCHIEQHVQHNISKLNIQYLGLDNSAVNIVALPSLLIWVRAFTFFFILIQLKTFI